MAREKHSYFVPELKKRIFSLSPLSMIFSCKFFIDALYQVEGGLAFLFLVCWKFLLEWVLNFVKCFICIYWDNHVAFVLYSINMHFTLINVQILNQSCITEISPTWSWCIILFLFQESFCQYFVEDFCIYIHEDISLQFYFLVISLSDFDIWVILAS